MRAATAPVIALLLCGCQVAPAAPRNPAPAMVFDRIATGPMATPGAQTPVGAEARPPLPLEWSAGGRPAVPFPREVATNVRIDADRPATVGETLHGGSGRSGGSAGPGDPADQVDLATDAFLVSPDGRPVRVMPGDAVPIPARLAGLWSYFAPGRVPTSIELSDGPAPILHPSAVEPVAATVYAAEVFGRVNPPAAGVVVAYCAPGRRSYPAVASEPDGSFRLIVEVAGPEDGVLLARAGTTLRALRATQVEPGALVEVPTLDLVAPTTAASSLPQPPAGLAIVERAIVAIVPTGSGAFPLPLWSSDAAPFEGPTAYPLPEVPLASRLVALDPTGSSGSAVSGPVDEPSAFLPPPDLAGLPASLAAGATLAWPAVPGATLYTLRLTSPAAAAPLWEAAVHSPRVALPQVRLDPRMALEVAAWDVAGLTTYSVASLRALRLPDGLPDRVGRRSWSTRFFGPAIKP